MPFSRRGIFVRIVFLASCIATAGELAAQPKTPVPDAQAQQTAKKAAGELFADRFTQAKTTAEKTALATDMMDAAGKVQAGSADQYVLLKIALDVAAGTGDAATALQAVERLLEQFDEPAAELIGDTLLTAARQATTSAQHKAVAEAALSIAGKLSDADQYETALRLCEAARVICSAGQVVSAGQGVDRPDRGNQTPTTPVGGLPQGVERAGRQAHGSRGEPGRRSASVFRQGQLGPRRPDVGAGERRGVEGGSDQGSARGEFSRRAGRDRRRVVGRGGNQAGRGAGHAATAAGFWYRQAEPKLAGGLAGLKIKQRLADIGEARLARSQCGPAQLPTGSQAPAPGDRPVRREDRQAASDAWAKHLKVPVVATNSIGMRIAIDPAGRV